RRPRQIDAGATRFTLVSDSRDSNGHLPVALQRSLASRPADPDHVRMVGMATEQVAPGNQHDVKGTEGRGKTPLPVDTLFAATLRGTAHSRADSAAHKVRRYERAQLTGHPAYGKPGHEGRVYLARCLCEAD